MTDKIIYLMKHLLENGATQGSCSHILIRKRAKVSVFPIGIKSIGSKMPFYFNKMDKVPTKAVKRR